MNGTKDPLPPGTRVGHDPLWVREDGDPIPLNHSAERLGVDLGAPADLVAAIDAWDDEFQVVYDPDGLADSGFPDEATTAAWHERASGWPRDWPRCCACERNSARVAKLDPHPQRLSVPSVMTALPSPFPVRRRFRTRVMPPAELQSINTTPWRTRIELPVVDRPSERQHGGATTTSVFQRAGLSTGVEVSSLDPPGHRKTDVRRAQELAALFTSFYQQNRTPSSRYRRAVTTTAAAVLAAGALVFTDPVPTARAEPRRDAVQQGMDKLVGADRHPGALAAVRDRRGRTRHYTAGVGDLRTGGEVPTNGRVRIGSASKMFTSVVVLQLVGEGRVELDASIETYLPGLVRGTNVDATGITVRQLLQHDSGLPDHTDSMFKTKGDFLSYQHVYLEPRQLLDLANAREDGRAAGGGWSYSNTNYLLAGLIAQRVTGRPFDELVTTRVVQRIGLRDTYAPEVGEEDIRGRHPRGYQRDPATDELVDFTRMDPSWGWAAGHLVSTPGDLNTFLRALLDGKLLEPAQLAQLRTTIPTDPKSGRGYGLGVFSMPLSCGGVAWGHGGDIPGYATVNAATDDGRAATVVVTSLTGSVKDESVAADRGALVDAALCAN